MHILKVTNSKQLIKIHHLQTAKRRAIKHYHKAVLPNMCVNAPLLLGVGKDHGAVKEKESVGGGAVEEKGTVAGVEEK